MTPLTYRTTSQLCGVVFVLLCATLLLLPGLIFWLFDLTANDATRVIAKRAAILFLGLASLMLMTASQPSNPTRVAIQRAIALMLVALAGLGAIEWMIGHVGIGIWLAIVTEVVLAGAILSAR